MKFADIKYIVKQVYIEWTEDKGSQLAAALSCYAIFSIAPLIVISVIIAGRFFGDELARSSIQRQLQALIGSPGAQVIEEIITTASGPTGGLVATLVGIGTLIFGSSGVFLYLQTALNTMWDVAEKRSSGVLATIKDRFFSFTMVLGVGFLLLVSLVINASLTTIIDLVGNALSATFAIAYIINFVVSFVVTTVIFALIYKIVPDAVIEWQDVLIGSIFTAVLFMIGKWLIGLYLGSLATNSTFGAFGSIIALLAWVYYSAHLLFLGAEFTQVYANKYGSKIRFVQAKDISRASKGLPPTE